MLSCYNNSNGNRTIGVSIVRGNAQHKLARLHYIRATVEEAAVTCEAHHSDNDGSQAKIAEQTGSRNKA